MFYGHIYQRKFYSFPQQRSRFNGAKIYVGVLFTNYFCRLELLPSWRSFFSLLPFSNSLNSVKKIMDSKHSPVRDGRIAVSVRYQGVRAGRPLLPCRVFWFMTNYIIKFLWLVNPIATQIKLVVWGRFVSLWVFIIRCNSSVYQMSDNRKCLKKHSI